MGCASSNRNTEKEEDQQQLRNDTSGVAGQRTGVGSTSAANNSSSGLKPLHKQASTTTVTVYKPNSTNSRGSQSGEMGNKTGKTSMNDGHELRTKDNVEGQSSHSNGNISGSGSGNGNGNGNGNGSSNVSSSNIQVNSNGNSRDNRSNNNSTARLTIQTANQNNDQNQNVNVPKDEIFQPSLPRSGNAPETPPENPVVNNSDIAPMNLNMNQNNIQQQHQHQQHMQQHQQHQQHQQMQQPQARMNRHSGHDRQTMQNNLQNNMQNSMHNSQHQLQQQGQQMDRVASASPSTYGTPSYDLAKPKPLPSPLPNIPDNNGGNNNINNNNNNNNGSGRKTPVVHRMSRSHNTSPRRRVTPTSGPPKKPLPAISPKSQRTASHATGKQRYKNMDNNESNNSGSNSSIDKEKGHGNRRGTRNNPKGSSMQVTANNGSKQTPDMARSNSYNPAQSQNKHRMNSQKERNPISGARNDSLAAANTLQAKPKESVVVDYSMTDLQQRYSNQNGAPGGSARNNNMGMNSMNNMSNMNGMNSMNNMNNPHNQDKQMVNTLMNVIDNSNPNSQARLTTHMSNMLPNHNPTTERQRSASAANGSYAAPNQHNQHNGHNGQQNGNFPLHIQTRNPNLSNTGYPPPHKPNLSHGNVGQIYAPPPFPHSPHSQPPPQQQQQPPQQHQPSYGGQRTQHLQHGAHSHAPHGQYGQHQQHQQHQQHPQHQSLHHHQSMYDQNRSRGSQHHQFGAPPPPQGAPPTTYGLHHAQSHTPQPNHHGSYAAHSPYSSHSHNPHLGNNQLGYQGHHYSQHGYDQNRFARTPSPSGHHGHDKHRRKKHKAHRKRKHKGKKKKAYGPNIPPPPSSPAPENGNSGGRSKNRGKKAVIVNRLDDDELGYDSDESVYVKQYTHARSLSFDNSFRLTAQEFNAKFNTHIQASVRNFNAQNYDNDDEKAASVRPVSTQDEPHGLLTEKEFYHRYWIEVDKLGEGSFAKVRKTIRKSDKKQFALKMIKKAGKSKDDLAALEREIAILDKLNHPNVVGLYDWCETDTRIYMVVEFCDGGDVFERILKQKTFNEKEAAHVIKQVAEGLKHIHKHGIVHRDLKPDNLMYLSKDAKSQIKIIDFGLAGDASGGPLNTPCGTAHYVAPEVLSNVPYDNSADMWSLGVIIYMLLCGFPPFFDAQGNQKRLYKLIKLGKYRFPSPYWDYISENAKDLIRNLLKRDPQTRYSAKQVLKHKWIAGSAAFSDFSDIYMEQLQHFSSSRRFADIAVGKHGGKAPPKATNLFANQKYAPKYDYDINSDH